MIDGIETDTGGLQTVTQGMAREPRVMLLTSEALFLGGGDDASILDQRGGAVVIERRQAENAHAVTAPNLE